MQDAALHWKRYERYFGLALRHEEVDDVISRFAALNQYAVLADRDDFLALAKELDVSPRMVRRLIEEVCEGVGGAASDVLRDTEDALGASLSKLRDIEVFARAQIDRLGIKGA